MYIHIQTRGFSLTEALRGYAKRRLKSSLAASDQHILSTQVRLSDINGPRGGIDKCCQLQVELAGSPSIIVRETSADMYSAIDRAAQRLGRSVSRRLGKFRSPKRLNRIRKAILFDKYAPAV